MARSTCGVRFSYQPFTVGLHSKTRSDRIQRCKQAIVVAQSLWQFSVDRSFEYHLISFAIRSYFAHDERKKPQRDLWIGSPILPFGTSCQQNRPLMFQHKFGNLNSTVTYFLGKCKYFKSM